MTDFVIVAVAVAAVASASPTGPAAAPDRLPTVGFKTYQSIDSCQQAAAQLQPPPGSRLVCLSVELPEGGLVSAY